MKRLAACIFLFFALALAFNNSPTAHAVTGTNQQINFQGRLTAVAGGVVIPDGNYNMEFKIYQDGDGVLGGGG